MIGPLVPPQNCAGCAFWHKKIEKEGLCRRHAPEASNRPEEVAHWPQTHSWQWCGEGVAAAPLSIGSRCADCVFWRHLDRGLTPVNRGDMPLVWWTHAGICARHAPHPELRTRSACFLAGDAGHGFLRRRRGAGAGPRIAALAKRAMVGERSTSLRPTPPDRSRGPGSKAGDCVGPGAQGPRCSA